MTPHRPSLRSLTLTSGLSPTPNTRLCDFASLTQMLGFASHFVYPLDVASSRKLITQSSQIIYKVSDK